MRHMSGESIKYSLILLTCFCFFLAITPKNGQRPRLNCNLASSTIGQRAGTREKGCRIS